MKMSENNDYIQLPPLKKDTPSDVVAFMWEYMKVPEDSAWRRVFPFYCLYIKGPLYTRLFPAKIRKAACAAGQIWHLITFRESPVRSGNE